MVVIQNLLEKTTHGEISCLFHQFQSIKFNHISKTVTHKASQWFELPFIFSLRVVRLLEAVTLFKVIKVAKKV